MRKVAIRTICSVYALLIIAGCSQNRPADENAFNRVGFAEFTYEGKTVHIDKVKMRIKKTNPDAFLNIRGTRKCYCSISNGLSEDEYRANYEAEESGGKRPFSSLGISFEVPFDSVNTIKDLEGLECEEKVCAGTAFDGTSLMGSQGPGRVKFLKIDTEKLRAYGTFSFTAYRYGEDLSGGKEVFIPDGIFFAEIEDLEVSGLKRDAEKK